MRTLIISIILSFSMSTICMATTNDHSYLKIELHQKTISYPPGTPFLARDAEGNTILSMYDLKQVQVYEITEPITLIVYVSWSDSPDTYTLESGKLSLENSKKHLKKVNAKEKTPPTAYFERASKNKSTHEKDAKKAYHTVYLIKKQYFSYAKETGYDVSLEFSNGILCLYRDGKANAWKNGKSLPIKHKYIIQTDEGALKLSYNPQTQKIWWIFDKE